MLSLEYEGMGEVKLKSMEDIFYNGKHEIVIRMRDKKNNIRVIYSGCPSSTSFFPQGMPICNKI